MTRLGRYNLLMTMVCCLLALALSSELSASRDVEKLFLRSSEPMVSNPERLTLDRPSRSQVSTISKRPLFVSSRRPPQNLAAASASKPSAPDVVLTGIAVAGGAQRAIVRVAQGEPQLFEPGERIAGWRLFQISDRSIVLKRGAEQFVASLGDEIGVETLAGAHAGASEPGSVRVHPKLSQSSHTVAIQDMSDIID